GVPASSAHLLSNHYNQTRTDYYRQLDRASKSGGEVIPFLTYALQGFVDGLREQIKVIRDQQWDVTWRNYVHEQFKGQSSVSAIRRKELVLDLSRQSAAVPLSQVDDISSRTAIAYTGKTARTVMRDL